MYIIYIYIYTVHILQMHMKPGWLHRSLFLSYNTVPHNSGMSKHPIIHNLHKMTWSRSPRKPEMYQNFECSDSQSQMQTSPPPPMASKLAWHFEGKEEIPTTDFVWGLNDAHIDRCDYFWEIVQLRCNWNAVSIISFLTIRTILTDPRWGILCKARFNLDAWGLTFHYLSPRLVLHSFSNEVSHHKACHDRELEVWHAPISISQGGKAEIF